MAILEAGTCQVSADWFFASAGTTLVLCKSRTIKVPRLLTTECVLSTDGLLTVYVVAARSCLGFAACARALSAVGGTGFAVLCQRKFTQAVAAADAAVSGAGFAVFLVLGLADVVAATLSTVRWAVVTAFAKLLVAKLIPAALTAIIGA